MVSFVRSAWLGRIRDRAMREGEAWTDGTSGHRLGVVNGPHGVRASGPTMRVVGQTI
jgi:hypothetical protein